ncbi:MAG: amidohydrolase family protein [Actinomycetota bacterium]
MSAIDTHAHWFPPAIVERFAELGGPKVWPAHSESLAERVEELERADVKMQILGLGHNQPSIENEQKSVMAARFANDLYAEAVREQPRLGAFGSLPLPHVEASVIEADRCLHDLRLQGVHVGTTAMGKSLDDPSYIPLWQFLNQQKAVVFVHPVGTPDTFSTGMDGFMIGPSLGGPHEAGISALRLVQSGITLRFPDINWIIAPMGGTLALLWRRFEDISQSVGTPNALGADPVSKIRSMYFDTTLSDDPNVLRFVAAGVGVDRIVLGTDAPRVGVADWLERTERGLNLSPEAWSAVRGQTLERLLGNRIPESVEGSWEPSMEDWA